MDLCGAVSIVTGSGRGIGRAIAIELARGGGLVACASIDESEVTAVVGEIRELGAQAIGMRADVSDPAQVEEMVARTIDAFGRVDVLVNNAGIFRAIGGLWEVEPEAWWNDVRTNLLGTFLCCRAVLPQMMRQDRGTIINMVGGGFDRPNAGGSGYAASKAGIARLTDTLAAELEATSGVGIYGLWPGFVNSGMTQSLAQDAAGGRWLPHVGEGLARGEDHPAEDVGRALVRLLERVPLALSGRIFSYDDDFEQIARSAGEILKQDLHQLRMKCLKPSTPSADA